MSPPDVVFPVRRGEDNEELRYALRSLRHVPHGEVWVAGHAPRWLQGARHVPTSQNRTKHENALRNLVAACRQPGLSDEFLLWNDDMFLLRPVDRVPTLHCGTVEEFGRAHGHLGESAYMVGMQATADVLAILGYLDPLCYELHVPMPMNKHAVLEAWAKATAGGMPRTTALQIRTMHGALLPRPEGRADDVKVYELGDGWEPGGAWVSTCDFAWGNDHPAALHVRETHAERGEHEKPGARLTVAKGAKRRTP